MSTGNYDADYDAAFPDTATSYAEYPPPSPQELFDADLVALVKSLNKLVALDAAIIFRTEQAHTAWWRMKKDLEQFEPWLETDNDPRSMGWVDDKGRP